jgi:hypothetical protein
MRIENRVGSIATTKKHELGRLCTLGCTLEGQLHSSFSRLLHPLVALLTDRWTRLGDVGRHGETRQRGLE